MSPMTLVRLIAHSPRQDPSHLSWTARKSTTIDLASSEGLDGNRAHIIPVSRLKAVSRVVNVYILPRQLDEKAEKFTFRHSARSSPSLTENKQIFMVVEAESPFKDPHYRYRAVKLSRWCCHWLSWHGGLGKSESR